MPKGPRVHEIFNNNPLGNTAPQGNNNSVFSYDGQESKQQTQLALGKKTTFAPQPPGMKKFGGYKPKILSAENTDNLIESNAGLSAVLNTANLQSKLKSRPVPAIPTEGQSSAAVLTKPKPFIVGDKDIPMVLSTVGDNDDDNLDNNVVLSDENRNEIKDVSDSVDDLHIYHTVIDHEEVSTGPRGQLQNAPSLDSFAYSENSNLIPSRNDPETHEFINYALDHDDSVVEEATHFPQHPTANHRELATPTNGVELPIANGLHVSPDYHQASDEQESQGVQASGEQESQGVHIPEPDYEEDEKTLTFTEEDTDASDGTGEEERLRKERRINPVLKASRYEGEDLSRFLSDDDETEIEVVEKPNQKARKLSTSSNRISRTEPRQKVSPKNSLFKQQTVSGKRKGSGKGQPVQFNSVRSFSYADSKIGTQGRSAGKRLNYTDGPDDNQRFVNDSSYESFLRSRHGDAMPFPESSDSGVDMADDSSHRKQGPIWKKLTLRLKNRKSKDFS
ncbi:uncharacterized protein LOC101851579 [Aplysia californica]|uniref:Uncharacterized protein LOC101851579 n=1 Tax=Aplysia californica TaxID=6500 RepID=A0ABM0JP74_APLCA|nr:uncharacterized protein LOC101851579 [Aplysia californica]XP_005098297.1 uncharacterized protein LOC101851579 [Aplysia californica]XP_005098298.1 uncharacterized protein LOC101851579 [Aplysia californica]XP_035825628.1 uncharacterized protein LOC101851579 [Aplysia californica]